MANWYNYYTEKGEKIIVTGEQLMVLAEYGKITPETIIENMEGKKAPARRVKGLSFSQTPLAELQRQSAEELPRKQTLTQQDILEGQMSRARRLEAEARQREVEAQAVQKRYDEWKAGLIRGQAEAEARQKAQAEAAWQAAWQKETEARIQRRNTMGLWTVYIIAAIIWLGAISWLVMFGNWIPLITLVILATCVAILRRVQDTTTKQHYCTNCGNSVSFWAGACPSCGAAPTKHKKFCRQCSTALNPEQVVCVKCNAHVNASTGGVVRVFPLVVGVVCGVWLLSTDRELGMWFGIIMLVLTIGNFLRELVMAKK